MANTVQSRRMAGAALSNAEADIAVGLPAVTQSSHGLAVGEIVRQSANDTFVTAQADSEANLGVGLSLVVGVISTDIHVPLHHSNSHDVTLTAHGFGSFGQKLWLSQGTAGLITATEPTTGFRWYLGYVIGTNSIRWEPWADWQEV